VCGTRNLDLVRSHGADRAKPNQDDLATLADLLTTGAVTPVIDRTYQLDEAAEAIRCLEQGHARGKVVIRV